MGVRRRPDRGDARVHPGRAAQGGVLLSAVQRHIGVVRGIYAAINAKHLDALGPHFDTTCVRHYPRGHTPIAGDLVGRDAVIASYRYVRTPGGRLPGRGRQVLANDVIAASYHREVGTRGRDAAGLDAEMLVRWQFRDGLVSEIWDFANDIPALNDFLR